MKVNFLIFLIVFIISAEAGTITKRNIKDVLEDFKSSNVGKKLLGTSEKSQYNSNIDVLKLPLLIEEVPENENEGEIKESSKELHSLITENGDNLLLVHVLFRHGNRTGEPMDMYPKDPYRYMDYFPTGLGQLTSVGKFREYNVGLNLRRRYNNFLGELYYPELVDARSTDVSRTKMSLELVLAGLFPPSPDDSLAKVIGNWQPVPYSYERADRDKLLLGILCPKQWKEYEQYELTPKMQGVKETYKETFDYLSKNTGGNVTDLYGAFNLCAGLKSQEEYGLKLPEWTKQVYPDVLNELSILQYYALMGTYETRKIFAGALLKKIIEDSKKRLYSNDGRKSKKIYLYSAHEFNIATLLIALDVFNNQIPNYGAHVIIEFHVINGVPGFKFFYDNWTGTGPNLLDIPGCGTFCPLKKLVHLIANILPLENEDVCGNN